MVGLLRIVARVVEEYLLAEQIAVDMRIDLCCGNAFVAEHCLDGP